MMPGMGMLSAPVEALTLVRNRTLSMPSRSVVVYARMKTLNFCRRAAATSAACRVLLHRSSAGANELRA